MSRSHQPAAAAEQLFQYEDDGTSTQHRFGDILGKVAAAADAVFGTLGWRFFVASDSPELKRLAKAHLAGRARFVASISGRVGHNNIRLDAAAMVASGRR